LEGRKEGKRGRSFYQKEGRRQKQTGPRKKSLAGLARLRGGGERKSSSISIAVPKEEEEQLEEWTKKQFREEKERNKVFNL